MSRKKHIVNLIFVLALLAATSYFLLRGNRLPELFALIGQTDWRFLLLGLLIIGLFFAMEALGVRTLLRSAGYRLPFGRCYGYALADFYFSAITPGCCGGQPAQIYYMKRDGIALGASSLSLLLFNLSYHGSVLLVAGAAWISGGMGTVAGSGPLRYLLIYGASAQLLLMLLFFGAVFSPRLMPALVEGAIGLLARLRIVKEPERWLDRARVQIRTYREGAIHMRRHPGTLVGILCLTTLHLLALYTIPFCVYEAFGLSGHGFREIVAIQASMTLALESLPIPGGIGVTEGSFLVVYGAIFGPHLVLPALLLCRGLNYYCGLAAGGLASVILQNSPGRYKGRESLEQLP